MGNLYESLKDYFENTPKNVLDNDWKEIEYLNIIGPDVIEYAEYVTREFGIAVPYSNSGKGMERHKYDVSVCANGINIAADSKYYFAA